MTSEPQPRMTDLAGGGSPGIAARLARWPAAPGVVLAVTVASAGHALRDLPGLQLFSPVILSVLVGLVFANLVGRPAGTAAGVAFCQRSVLRFAIVLLGLQLTVDQLLSIGATGAVVVAASLVATMAFTLALARLIGVERGLAALIAAGTAVCGASAIVAVNAVTRARDEDVAYAVASITLFGTVAMIGFPFVAPGLGLDARAFGLWAGASIHEVAQVVGAGFQAGDEAGETAMVAKMARVVLLAPLVVVLGALARRGPGGATPAPPVPWFVAAFVAVVLLNGLVALPDGLREAAATLTTFLLSVGLAALGLNTDVSEVRARGWRPFALSLAAFLFIAAVSLGLVKGLG